MTRIQHIVGLLAVATLAACADTPSVAPASLEAHGTVARLCTIDDDFCDPVSDLLDVASIDVGDAYIESTAGRRYHVSVATQFLPVALPPNPIFPNDPVYASLFSWNALVESRGSYRAFLGQLRQLPPNPILPPNPVRFQAEALFDGTAYQLVSLRPVLVN